MIETASYGNTVQNTPDTHQKAKKVLHMERRNDRMGGSVPVWTSSKTARESVEQKLAQASAPETANADSFESAMALTAQAQPPMHEPEEFTFGDLVDMVNPLHHLPIVGHIYRELTGDEIKPISKIVGGAAFGGMAGAATSLVDAVIQYETGKDITGNVMALASGEKPTYRSTTDQPEARLNEAVKTAESAEELSPHILGFTDMGYGKKEIYERVQYDNDRMAGSYVRKRTVLEAPNPVREPITQVSLPSLPRWIDDVEASN